MRRLPAIALTVSLALIGAAPVGATHDEDDHSKNISQLAQVPIVIDKESVADGSDMAFQGNLLIAGTYQGTSIFKMLKGKPYIKQVGFHNCSGAQGDVSVWGDLVFVSLDGPSSDQNEGCNNTDESAGKEGIRIIDISDPTNPRQVKFVETPCGSHTHTLAPAGDVVYIYIESYPLVQSASCNVQNHRKVPIVKVPLDDVSKSEVVGALDVTPVIGCHDVTVVPERDLAVAACISESQIWDIKDPANPVIIGRIYNPSIGIHHSAAITWDAKYMVIGDEFAGSVTGTCVGERPSPIGAMWFYDISNPALPIPVGYYNIPRRALPETSQEAGYMACTTHNFNVLPMKEEGKYIVAAGYRNTGLSIVDFSDPANATEIAHYLDFEEGLIPDVWAGYWYNGRIYTTDNGTGRGISVYELEGTSSKEVHFFKGRMNPQIQVASFK